MDTKTPAKDQKITIILSNKGTNRIIPVSIDNKTPVTSELLFRDTKKSPKSDLKVDWVKYKLITNNHSQNTNKMT